MNTSERDWPEDFSHENGNYQRRCMYCNELFLGYKRRVCCKQCASSGETRLVLRDESADMVFHRTANFFIQSAAAQKLLEEIVEAALQRGDDVQIIHGEAVITVRQ